jgi:hypothetical protein
VDLVRPFAVSNHCAAAADGLDALQLDYDNPGNPFFVRWIKDEVREVAPGLGLGQA